MTQSLSRRQAAVLGLVVLAALAGGGYGLARIADKQGLFAETADVAVGFAEPHDIAPGTPVRVRGVDAGQVVAVEYPADDHPGAEVTLRLRVQARFAARLYADASARITSSGVFGAKVVAIDPGTPERGPLAGGRLRGVKPFGLDEAVAEVKDTAGAVKGLVKEATHTAGEVKKLAADARATSAAARELITDVRESTGTVAKLLKDDDLYRDLKDIAADARTLVKRTDKAVGTVEGEMANLKGFVTDGRETLRSVKQGTDAVARMPLIRSYVEDSAALLVRPAHARERMVYNTADLFQPGTAIPRDDAADHFEAIAGRARELPDKRTEVVVVAFCDPADPGQTSASALELTKKQSDAVVEYLKARGVHKLGWTTARRKMTALGMGMNPSPAVEKEPVPASNLQVLMFTPR